MCTWCGCGMTYMQPTCTLTTHIWNMSLYAHMHLPTHIWNKSLHAQMHPHYSHLEHVTTFTHAPSLLTSGTHHYAAIHQTPSGSLPDTRRGDLLSGGWITCVYHVCRHTLINTAEHLPLWWLCLGRQREIH